MHKTSDILEKLKSLKPKYQKEGVIILGLFGSCAQNCADDESDIDILIETDKLFLSEHADGFSGFSRLAAIREELENYFASKVDLVDKTGLLQHDNTHILKSAIYV